jgi:hypothetical protein
MVRHFDTRCYGHLTRKSGHIEDDPMDVDSMDPHLAAIVRDDPMDVDQVDPHASTNTAVNHEQSPLPLVP